MNHSRIIQLLAIFVLSSMIISSGISPNTTPTGQPDNQQGFEGVELSQRQANSAEKEEVNTPPNGDLIDTTNAIRPTAYDSSFTLDHFPVYDSPYSLGNSKIGFTGKYLYENPSFGLGTNVSLPGGPATNYPYEFLITLNTTHILGVKQVITNTTRSGLNEFYYRYDLLDLDTGSVVLSIDNPQPVPQSYSSDFLVSAQPRSSILQVWDFDTGIEILVDLPWGNHLSRAQLYQDVVIIESKNTTGHVFYNFYNMTTQEMSYTDMSFISSRYLSADLALRDTFYVLNTTGPSDIVYTYNMTSNTTLTSEVPTGVRLSPNDYIYNGTTVLVDPKSEYYLVNLLTSQWQYFSIDPTHPSYQSWGGSTVDIQRMYQGNESVALVLGRTVENNGTIVQLNTTTNTVISEVILQYNDSTISTSNNPNRPWMIQVHYGDYGSDIPFLFIHTATAEMTVFQPTSIGELNEIMYSDNMVRVGNQFWQIWYNSQYYLRIIENGQVLEEHPLNLPEDTSNLRPVYSSDRLFLVYLEYNSNYNAFVVSEVDTTDFSVIEHSRFEDYMMNTNTPVLIEDGVFRFKVLTPDFDDALIEFDAKVNTSRQLIETSWDFNFKGEFIYPRYVGSSINITSIRGESKVITPQNGLDNHPEIIQAVDDRFPEATSFTTDIIRMDLLPGFTLDSGSIMMQIRIDINFADGSTSYFYHYMLYEMVSESMVSLGASIFGQYEGGMIAPLVLENDIILFNNTLGGTDIYRIAFRDGIQPAQYLYTTESIVLSVETTNTGIAFLDYTKGVTLIHFSHVWDTHSPRTALQTTPIDADDQSSTTVRFSLTDGSGIASVSVHYSVNSVDSGQLVPVFIENTTYEVIFPVLDGKAMVEFQVESSDTRSNSGISMTYQFIVTDTTPPVLNTVSVTEIGTFEKSFSVEVTAIDPSGIGQVILQYQTDSSSAANITMSHQESGEWNATLPAFANNTEVEYRIYIADTQGNWLISDTYYHVVIIKPDGTTETTNPTDPTTDPSTDPTEDDPGNSDTSEDNQVPTSNSPGLPYPWIMLVVILALPLIGRWRQSEIKITEK